MRARRHSCRHVYFLILMFSVLGSRKLGGEWGNSWYTRDRRSGGRAGILREEGGGVCK